MARQLKVRLAWLRDEADAGRVPHVKAGQRYLFHPPAVEKVLIERATREGLRPEHARGELEAQTA